MSGMIIVIICLIAAAVFPYCLINAIKTKDDLEEKVFTTASCVSFAALIGLILFIVLHS